MIKLEGVIITYSFVSTVIVCFFFSKVFNIDFTNSSDKTNGIVLLNQKYSKELKFQNVWPTEPKFNSWKH